MTAKNVTMQPDAKPWDEHWVFHVDDAMSNF